MEKTMAEPKTTQFKRILRDVYFLFKVLKSQLFMLYFRLRGLTFLDYVEWYAKKMPGKTALVQTTFNECNDNDYNYECLTFLQLYRAVIHMDRKMQELEIQKNQAVSILMPNSPLYVACWLTLSNFGAISVLLNYNLTSEQLVHCITTSSSDMIIYSDEFADKVDSLKFKDEYQVKKINIRTLTENFNKNKKSNDKLVKRDRNTFEGKLLYIFTSGSTGLPKPVVLSLRKAVMFNSLGTYCDINEKDTIYSFMPLYHINSGMVALSQCLLNGATFVIRDKFSVSHFVSDCLKFKVNMFNYIGEVCRYLTESDRIKNDEDRKKINFRLVFGNGIREEVWHKMYSLFNIDKIGEFYGSTEGNASFVNLEGKVYCCGYIPKLANFLFNMYPVVKCDLYTGELIRDKHGRLIKCGPNEPGHFLSRIMRILDVCRFDGYVSKEDTSKKIARDCFKKGDSYFMTGDVVKYDEFNYLYFVDRVGDTFRCDGENVSTGELENLIRNYIENKINENEECFELNMYDLGVIVYGVPENEHTEGKVGMAAVYVKTEEQKGFVQQKITEAVSSLPKYQIPRYLRLSLDAMPITTTFKLLKVDLIKQAHDKSLFNEKETLVKFNMEKRCYVEI